MNSLPSSETGGSEKEQELLGQAPVSPEHREMVRCGNCGGGIWRCLACIRAKGQCWDLDQPMGSSPRRMDQPMGSWSVAAGGSTDGVLVVAEVGGSIGGK